MPDWLVWTHGCPGGETVAQVSDRADQAIAMALEHMESRDVVFVGHGHFSRAVLTRWVELPIYEGIRFAMVGRRRSRCADSSTGCASCGRWDSPRTESPP